MTKDEALRMCLEYIETDAHERKYVRHAIKEALAQPEPWEKFCDSNCVWTDHHPDCKLAQPEYQSTADKSKLEKVPAKGTLLAQPEQEPVAKNEEGRITWLVDDWPQNCFLYAEPPKWTPVEIGIDVTSEGAHVVGMYVLPDAVRYVFYSQFHTAPQRKPHPDEFKCPYCYDQPQRTWVGLTDEEIDQFEIWYDEEEERKGWVEPKLIAQYFETKLKEKNGC